LVNPPPPPPPSLQAKPILAHKKRRKTKGKEREVTISLC
jgi:hypothetical protein